ncbi:MAG TPA: ABC transporter substrate-binding protein [Methanothrix soehngenii]|nr:ABC transporter substrate-binding protein [Methanothrix soehngenii]
MRYYLILCYLICIMAAANSGCGTDSDAQEIRVGVMLPITGDWSSQGAISNVALGIADDDINSLLKDSGSSRRVNLTTEDTGTDPETALRELKNLGGQGIRLVIAAVSSSELYAMKDYANANNIIIIGTASTSPSLAIPEDNVIRLVPDDINQGKAMAELLKLENITAIVPITRGDVWGRGLLNATKSSFEGNGGVVLEGVSYEPGTDPSSGINKLSAIVKESKSRFSPAGIAVYMVSFDEAIPLMAMASRDPELSSVRWFGSDGIANSSSLAENSTAAEFACKTGLICPIYGVVPGQFIRNMSDYENVIEAIRQNTGSSPSGYALASYDALWIASESMILSESGNNSQLKEALTNIANRFTGITGPLSINNAGDRESATYQFLALNKTNDNYFWQIAGDFRSGPSGGVLNFRGQTAKVRTAL